jgi:hypothetical protein
MKLSKVIILFVVAFTTACGEKEGTTQGQIDSNLANAIVFERSDLPSVSPRSLFGKKGTYQLQSARAFYEASLNSEGRSSSVKMLMQFNLARQALEVLDQQVTGEAATVKGKLEFFNSINSETGEASSQFVSQFLMDSGSFESRTSVESVSISLLSRLSSLNDQDARIYLKPDGGFLVTARTNQTRGDSRLNVIMEVGYQFIPTPQASNSTMPAPSPGVTFPAEGETLAQWIDYFQKLREETHPYAYAMSGQQAVETAQRYYYSGLRLSQVKPIQEFFAKLRDENYPYSYAFSAGKSVEIAKEVSLSGISVDQLKDRVQFYMKLREQSYPYAYVYSTVNAVRMAFRELGITSRL